jgi:lysophospholipase L1-like esterase
MPRYAWLGLLLAPVLLLSGLELLLRNLWPQAVSGLPARLFEERDGLAFLRPGLEIVHRSRDFQVAVKASTLGYRAGVGCEELDDSIWVLGDSFGFGWGVPASATATARLAQSDQCAFNAAIPGDGLPEYARRLRLLAATGARPRAVVVLLFDNDLTAAEAERRGPSELVQSIHARGRPRPARQALVDTLVGLHVANLAGRGLRVVGLGSIAGEALGFRAGRERLLRRDLEIHRRGFTGSDAFAVNVERLEGILNAAHQLGASVAVLRVVAYDTGGGGDTERSLVLLGERREDFDFEEIDRALEARLGRASVPYSRVPDTASRVAADLYFRWDGHLTAAGQALLAEALRQLVDRATSNPRSDTPGATRAR